jgi:TRAP-type C4-dicarboxylate transport system substrate-binding protein
VEVFEMPFMMQSPEATSKAVWDYVEQYAKPEFKDVKALAFHVHGDGVFHMVNKPIRTAADLKGVKLRAPTRATNKFIAMLGATPVSMPVPQVGDALSKGVIDGAVVPYEVVPAVKIQELVKYHSETDPAEPAFYTSVFIFAMNQAKYDSLSPELKKVIDRNSGQALSGMAGKAFLQADGEGKKLVNKAAINVIPKAELENWKKLSQPLFDSWVSDMNSKGHNGKQMLDGAKALIAKHQDGK